MATVTVNDASLTAIAEAIRGKLDVETTYLPSQMAAAIESISGTDLTSADEGKVVVESSGEYVLAAQTSRSISQNGTYDTTTNDEVVVSVSGGGGGTTNILSGPNMPTAQDGSNGAIYIKIHPTYIEPNGDEYIDTGYIFTNETKIVANILVNKSRSNQYQFVFGGRNNSGGTTFAFSVRDSGTWRGRGIQSSNTYAYFESFPYNEMITLTVGNGSMSVSSESGVQTKSLDASGSGTQPIYLFSLREGSSDAGHYSSYRIYELSIYEGDELAMHFVPHLDGSNVACLRDTISGNIFYGGKTAGFKYVQAETITDVYLKVNGAWVLIEGQDIDDVDTGGGGGGTTDDWLTLTDYIESSGTQYIDTGYKVIPSTWVEMVANFTNTEGSPLFFGARNGSGSRDFWMGKSAANNVLQDGHATSYTNYQSGTPARYGGRKCKFTKKQDSSEIMADSVLGTGVFYGNGNVTGSYNLTIFTLNTGGSISTNYATMKLYRFRIYEDDTIVHEFVPWTDTNDVACLKDTVTGEVKYNLGTGTFTRGTDS